MDKRAAFAAWLESANDDAFDPGGYPEGVAVVGGAPSRVTFTAFTIS